MIQSHSSVSHTSKITTTQECTCTVNIEWIGFNLQYLPTLQIIPAINTFLIVYRISHSVNSVFYNFLFLQTKLSTNWCCYRQDKHLQIYVITENVECIIYVG